MFTPPEDTTAHGGFVLNFRVPDTSVNRTEPDGEPEDVLLAAYPKFKDWGIVSFSVSDIPSSHRRDIGKPIQFRIEHDPEDSNYYHSEIRAFDDDGNRRKSLKHLTETYFRLELSHRLTSENIIREPKV